MNLSYLDPEGMKDRGIKSNPSNNKQTKTILPAS